MKSALNQQQQSEKAIELVNRLSNNGELDKLLDAGIIGMKVILQREMYLQYDINRRIKKMKFMDACMCVASQFNCDWRTVYRAVVSMQKSLTVKSLSVIP